MRTNVRLLIEDWNLMLPWTLVIGPFHSPRVFAFLLWLIGRECAFHQPAELVCPDAGQNCFAFLAGHFHSRKRLKHWLSNRMDVKGQNELVLRRRRTAGGTRH